MEKLIVTQSNFLSFMEPVCSLQCSQEPTTGRILRQTNLFHTLSPYFPKVHSNIIHPSLPGSSEWSLPFSFPTKILYAFLISSVHATCPAHLILLDLITLMTFGEEYLHYAAFSSVPPLPHS